MPFHMDCGLFVSVCLDQYSLCCASFHACYLLNTFISFLTALVTFSGVLLNIFSPFGPSDLHKTRKCKVCAQNLQLCDCVLLHTSWMGKFKKQQLGAHTAICTCSLLVVNLSSWSICITEFLKIEGGDKYKRDKWEMGKTKGASHTNSICVGVDYFGLIRMWWGVV